MLGLFYRTRRWLLAATGGSMFVLSGCDPAVRDTVLSGVEGASTTLFTTFLQAFFETLQEDEEGAITTVKAIIEYVPDLLA